MMLFTEGTIQKSCKAFGQALKKHDLTLNLSSTQNAWARILVNKNYSALMAKVKHNGAIKFEFDPSHIISVLRTFNREADREAAIKLFVDATKDVLIYLDQDLCSLVDLMDGSCFYGVYLNQRGKESKYVLGLMRADKPGYLIMEPSRITRFDNESEGELIANMLNAYGVVPGVTEIIVKNWAATDKEKDKNLLEFFLKHEKAICEQLATDLWEKQHEHILQLMDIGDTLQIEDSLYDSLNGLLQEYKTQNDIVFIDAESPLAKTFYATCVHAIVDDVHWFRDLERTPEKIDYRFVHGIINHSLREILHITRLRDSA